MAISRSDGVVIVSVLFTFASTLLLPCSDFTFGRRRGPFLGLKFLQIIVEAAEVLVPEPSEAAQPAIDFSERDRRDPAGPPLRLAPAQDQAGMLQHLEMFRDCRKAHGERLREFCHRRLAARQARQNAPTPR